LDKRELLISTTHTIKSCCDENEGGSHVSNELQNRLIRRMNKVEGQVRGIRNMIQRNVYCDDILNQMSSVQSALHSVSRLLLENHMNTCVVDRIKENDPHIVEEFTKTISKIMK
jgi:CsoR family transcriptional regulator, copper-sensing transcriptional repressor